MKDCTGIYHYKGFTISFSETYQEWVAEPNFLLKLYGNTEEVINFISDHSYDVKSQKTINALKKEINSSIEKGIKEKLINTYERGLNQN